jgi:hypothetical protein
MVVKVNGKPEILNPNTYFTVRDVNLRRRKLFENGTFQVHKDGSEFYKLEIAGRFAGLWHKGDLSKAETVIQTAYLVWEIKK